MAIGIFLDKEHQPTPEEISAALGPVQPLWERLTRFISDAYEMPGELSYGGKKYGWNVWYRKSGKTLASLYPQEAHFVAQVVLGREQAEKAFALELGENVGRALRESPQLHDGRWLFIQVRTERDMEDIQQLLQIKKRPRRAKQG